MRKCNPWVIVEGGAFGLMGLLLAGVAGYWQYANQLPVYPTPNVEMPVPNAYDDYLAAGQMCRAAGGASVPAPPAHPAAPQQPSGAAAAEVPGSPPGGPGQGPDGEYSMPTSGVPMGGSGGASGAGRQRGAFEPGVPLAQVRAVVARSRPALTRLRRGFRKQYRSPSIVSFNQLVPEPAYCHVLAEVLVTEGKLAAREGRPNSAVHSYLDCLRLGTELPRGGGLLHGQVGISIESIGLRALQEVTGRLDGSTAAAAAREMARLDAQAPSLAETFANEKEATTAQLLDLLKIFRQPEARRRLLADMSDCSPSYFGLWVSVIPRRQMLNSVRGYLDALAVGSRRPYYDQPAPQPIPNDPLSQEFLFSLDHVPFGFKWALRDANWRITEARLATRTYEQRHGTPPPSLDALVPDYLPVVPQDPFAPKPLVYRRKGARVLIYSRGPDGQDDGGLDLGARVNPASRGDIVTMHAKASY